MKYLFAFLIPLTLISSCSPEEKKKNDNQDQKSDIQGDPEKKEPESKAETLRLDDGKKWKVNPETTVGVEKMIGRTESFQLNSSAEKYQSLFDSLDADFRYIFKKCTTEGVAHDQLHIMLFPLRGMFNKLKSPEEHIRQEALENIREQLSLYAIYFTN
ncbi:MAG: hypothetical protein R2799_02555 [Crocinitomicaceae bacterium]